MKQLLTFFARTSLVGLVLAVWAAPAAHAQADLLGQLEQENKKDAPTQVVDATFKGTRLINGHTVQTPGEGTMVFLISHRFGALNSGTENFFGLDNATLRLGFEYALTDRFEIGVGRSSLNKTVDSFLKYKAIQQTTGAHEMPVSVTLFSSAAIMTKHMTNGIDYYVGQAHGLYLPGPDCAQVQPRPVATAYAYPHSPQPGDKRRREKRRVRHRGRGALQAH